MIRIFNSRLVIENPITHAKTIPRIISASTQASYPFSVSGATIEIIPNIPPNLSGNAVNLSYYDIVRLQVSLKMSPNHATVWKDIFHGRIENISQEMGDDSNKYELYCSGHEAELKKDLIEETKSYTTSVDAKTLLSYFSKYFSRMRYSDSYASTGVVFPTYDSTQDQQFLINLVESMEETAGYDWAFKAIPTYDSNKNLSNVYAQWKPFSTTPVKSYQVIEGTFRFIKASFCSEGEGVITNQIIRGDTPQSTGTTTPQQYRGAYTDTALESKYGRMSAVETYPWIKSNDLCVKVAEGVQKGIRLPVISGQITIIGTPQAQVGDYIYVKIPSQRLNRAPVIGYFYVYRVQHVINSNQYHTIIDVGKVKPVAEDYIAKISKTATKLKCAQVK